MRPNTDKWSWFGTGAFLLFAIGVPVGTVALPGAKFVDTVIRICSAPSYPAAAEQTSFFAQNSAAMSRMMIGMAIEPTGDVDRDFVAMMVPHHQGAIDMAQAELRYGHNQQLLRIAQEIVVKQSQEIAAMRLAVGDPASPTWVTSAPHEAPAAAPPLRPTPDSDAPFISRSTAAMDTMMTSMIVKPAGDVDHGFVAMMVPHHQGAIDMAQAELQYGDNSELKTVAQEIIVDQMQEITLMRLALGEPLPQSVSSPTQAFSGAMQISSGKGSYANQTSGGNVSAMQMAPTRSLGVH